MSSMLSPRGLPPGLPPFILVTLRRIPGVKGTTDRDLMKLCKLIKETSYEAGTVIREAAKQESLLCIIKEGEVTVATPPGKIGIYDGIQKEKFQFGAGIFSSREKIASFTVTAKTDVKAWTLSRLAYKNHKNKARKRYVVAGAPVNISDVKTSANQGDKSKSELDRIHKALKRCVLLSNLNDTMVKLVALHMERQKIEKGFELITQGDHGKHFYINNKGVFDIYVDGTKVAQKHPGDFFGELALMHNAVRSATVRAEGPAEVFRIESSQVRILVAKSSDEDTKARIKFLRKVKLLESLTPNQRAYMAESLKERTVLPGEAVVTQGEDGDEFFIVKSGELRIFVDDAEAGKLEVGGYEAGGYFGELALINNAKRAATVSAKEMSVVLSLKQSDFNKILGKRTLALLSEKSAEYSKKTTHARQASMESGMDSSSQLKKPTLEDVTTPVEKVTKMAEALAAASAAQVSATIPEGEAVVTAPKKKADKTVEIKSLDEVEILGTLGRGAFGHVRLVRDQQKRVHALKTLNKHLLVETQQVEHVRNELSVMSHLSSPFVVEFRGWFQDANHLHLVMQPSLGGELATLLDEKEVLEEDEARFASACMVLAIQHLHDKGIVYRDLKPENLLLEPSGYLKFVDFGFAKRINEARTFTLCGTPEYLSPEVIQGNGHGVATDWWSLGIIVFEMLTGETPYCDSNPMGTYQVIMRAEGVPWPEDHKLSEEARSFVEGLLTKDAPLRLGTNGVTGIKEHAWFKGFDWAKLEAGELPSPFPVEVSGEEDMSRFEDYMGEDDRWQDYEPEDPDPFKDFSADAL